MRTRAGTVLVKPAPGTKLRRVQSKPVPNGTIAHQTTTDLVNEALCVALVIVLTTIFLITVPNSDVVTSPPPPPPPSNLVNVIGGATRSVFRFLGMGTQSSMWSTAGQ